MLKKLCLILILATLINACGRGLANEWSGKVSGKFRVSEKAKSGEFQGTLLFEDKGGVSLEPGADKRLILNENTPLPGCVITFNSEPRYGQENGGEDSGIPRDVVYYKKPSGEANADKSCRGVVDKDAPPVEVNITHATVEASGYGSFRINVDYEPVGDPVKKRIFEISSGEKGWF